MADVEAGAERVPVRELEDHLGDADWLEAPVTSGTSPLTLVDLSADTTDRVGARALAAGGRAPWRVLVGYASEPRTDLPTALFDVLLCARAELEGWVAVHDVDASLAALASSCARAPTAAAVLSQVLRLNEHLSVAEGVLVESLAYSTLLAGPEFAAWLSSSPTRTHRPSAEPVVVGTEEATGTVTVTLNRPEVRNAYDTEMRDRLVDVLRSLTQLPDPPPVRLEGRGPSFCSGGDLSQFGTAPDPATAHGVRTSRSPGLLLQRLRATARVHGACVGAGIEMPAFCPLVQAEPGATFRLPEVAMGLIPGAGGTASITARIGRHRTAYLALSATELAAPVALRWGLVDTLEP